MPPLKFRTAGFPQYGFKPEPLNYRLPFSSVGLNAIPISTHLLKVCHSLRLCTPDPCSLIQGNSVSAVTSSALCPLLPVFSHSVAIRPAFSVSSNHPDPEALRIGRVMLSLPILANTTSSACLINSSRLPSLGYTEDLWHSRIAPACLSDSPLFICISLTGCHHPYAGKCIRCSRLFLP